MSRVRGLGDRVESALSVIGITEDSVSGWLGRPCNCRARKEKLNRLGQWAARVLSGAQPTEAKQELTELTGEPVVEEPKSGEVFGNKGDTNTDHVTDQKSGEPPTNKGDQNSEQSQTNKGDAGSDPVTDYNQQAG